MCHVHASSIFVFVMHACHPLATSSRLPRHQLLIFHPRCYMIGTFPLPEQDSPLIAPQSSRPNTRESLKTMLMVGAVCQRQGQMGDEHRKISSHGT
jgi:hypothetical protein